MAEKSRRKGLWSSKEEAEPSTAHDASKKEVEIDRYKHDVEQANAMRKKLSTATDSTSSRSLSTEDVNLALRGLQDADRYRKSGKLESALKLYELSLELLLIFLREGNPESHGIDAGTLEVQVVTAMSEAESVKATIDRMKLTQQASEPSGEISPGGFQSLSKALRSALNDRPSYKRRSQTSPPGPSYVRAVTGPRSSPTALQKPATTINSRVQSEKTSHDQLHDIILSDFFIDKTVLERTTWDDIAGLETVKQSLQETAILPLVRPDLFSGLRKPQNILLFGPPGTGKTMLVRAVAQESNSNLFVVTAGTLTSKWLGESEKLVRALFRVAREVAPSIIFIDEVDALLSARKSDGEHEASRRLKTEVMTLMDGISKDGGSDQKYVLVVACTNLPWDIDSAVLRRFPRRLYVPLPDHNGRRALLEKLLLKAGKHKLTSRQIEKIVRMTEGCSCSDLAAIASEASFGPLRSLGGVEAVRRVKEKDIRPINITDFENALNKAPKSVTSDHLRRYDEWHRETT